MKKPNNRNRTILLICLLLWGFTVYAQNELRPKIYAALQAYTNKEYLKSAQLYSEDFIERHYHVPVDKMLYAARTWALAGQPDSAFSCLNRLAKGNYPQTLEDIFADDAFDKLKNDNRWKSLTELLQAKGIKPEQSVKKNYMLIAELAIIEYDDQHHRLQSDGIEQKYGAQSPQMKAQIQLVNKHDSINRQKVKVILDKYGWPGADEIGDEASDAIYSVIQREGYDMVFKYLPLVKDAVKRKKYMLSAELAIIMHDDQYYRSQIDDIEKKYGTQSPQMKAQWQRIGKLDSIDQQKIKAILDKDGWPGPYEIGAEGSAAIFLVIQHAGLDMQLKYLPLVKDAVKRASLNAGSLALLEDRINITQHKKQVYGSQLTGDGTGKYYVLPLEDPDNVDKRRTAVGLQPLKEYLQYWKMEWDIEQYKKDLPKIEKLAGW